MLLIPRLIPCLSASDGPEIILRMPMPCNKPRVAASSSCIICDIADMDWKTGKLHQFCSISIASRSTCFMNLIRRRLMVFRSSYETFLKPSSSKSGLFVFFMFCLLAGLVVLFYVVSGSSATCWWRVGQSLSGA